MAKTEENEELRALRQQLEKLEKNKETYSSAYGSAMEAALQKLIQREEFSYDPAGDVLYEHYKNHYENAGRRAMMDTMGISAALTGGYGSSYAQTAGQQAYADQMQLLQEKIPELYQLALETYRAEGDALQQRYDLLSQREQQDYSRYRDRAADQQAQQKYLTERYNDAYSRYTDQRDYNYKVKRDKVSDDQWKKKFNESVRQFGVKNGW